MKKKSILLIFLILPLVSLYSQVKELPYSKEMMDVGNMYSYKVGELGGDNEMMLYFYIESEDKISFYNDFSSLAPFVFIGEGQYSKELSCFSNTKAYNPFSYMKLPLNKQSEVLLDKQDKSMFIDVSYFNRSGKEKKLSGKRKLDMLPAYETTLYQLDLWFSLRNYNGDYSPFEVGGMMNGRAFTNIVSYKGNENVMGEFCDVWEVREKGLFGKPSSNVQTIYMSSSDKYKKVIRYTNTQKVEPIGKLDVTLLERKAMTKNEWKEFIANITEDRRIKLGFPTER